MAGESTATLTESSSVIRESRAVAGESTTTLTESSSAIRESRTVVRESTAAATESRPGVGEPTSAMTEPSLAIRESTPVLTESMRSLTESKPAVGEPTMLFAESKPLFAEATVSLAKTTSALRCRGNHSASDLLARRSRRQVQKGKEVPTPRTCVSFRTATVRPNHCSRVCRTVAYRGQRNGVAPAEQARSLIIVLRLRLIGLSELLDVDLGHCQHRFHHSF